MKSDSLEELSDSRPSPSAWREWIEIGYDYLLKSQVTSPSAWREWIEIFLKGKNNRNWVAVSLRMEGVD